MIKALYDPTILLLHFFAGPVNNHVDANAEKVSCNCVISTRLLLQNLHFSTF